jgi:hypothetical protein
LNRVLNDAATKCQGKGKMLKFIFLGRAGASLDSAGFTAWRGRRVFSV